MSEATDLAAADESRIKTNTEAVELEKPMKRLLLPRVSP
jgi:hypothetical protein